MLIILRKFFAKFACTTNDQIEHTAIKRIVLQGGAWFVGFAKEAIEHIAGINLGWHCLGSRAETAMRIVAFVQSLLIFFMRLWHCRQLKRWQSGQPTDVVCCNLIGRNCDVNLIAAISIGKSSSKPGR